MKHQYFPVRGIEFLRKSFIQLEGLIQIESLFPSQEME